MGDFPWVAATVASHHRDAAVIDRRYDWIYPDGLALDTLLGGFDDQTLSSIADWLATAPGRWIAELGLEDAGISVPDRIATGTDPKAFRGSEGQMAVLDGLKAYAKLRRGMDDGDVGPVQSGILYRGTMLLADRLGSADASQLLALELPPAETLVSDTLRDYQNEAARASGAVLLVAPTGSGKTEAALIWARQQQIESSLHQTLVYLLPYQASLNAMHRRLQEVLHADVGLLHGRSTLALFRQLLSDGYDSHDATRVARRARNLAGLQQPAVQVATPYQLLRAAYRLPGYEMIWAGLYGAMIVVDELHAYDPHRSGLILGLLRRLIRDWGAQVCAMTATMPTWLRSLARDALGATGDRGFGLGLCSLSEA